MYAAAWGSASLCGLLVPCHPESGRDKLLPPKRLYARVLHATHAWLNGIKK